MTRCTDTINLPLTGESFALFLRSSQHFYTSTGSPYVAVSNVSILLSVNPFDGIATSGPKLRSW